MKIRNTAFMLASLVLGSAGVASAQAAKAAPQAKASVPVSKAASAPVSVMPQGGAKAGAAPAAGAGDTTKGKKSRKHKKGTAKK